LLLRLDGEAKRQEQSAKRKAKAFFSHEFSPSVFVALCSLLLAI
jgi:hypothetical protein